VILKSEIGTISTSGTGKLKLTRWPYTCCIIWIFGKADTHNSSLSLQVGTMIILGKWYQVQILNVSFVNSWLYNNTNCLIDLFDHLVWSLSLSLMKKILHRCWTLWQQQAQLLNMFEWFLW